MLATELAGGVYYVCMTCKDGKYAPSDEESNDSKLSGFLEHHTKIHHPMKVILATEFLSIYIQDGYVDIDRPNLEPLPLVGKKTEQTGGLPISDVTGALALQRKMRRSINDAVIDPPGSMAEAERGIIDVMAPRPRDERPKIEPRQPSIKDMQVTLPWTVKYSRDYRANPQTHKDFAHAVMHTMKALGKLTAIVDDYDHRRASELDPKAKDYIADLVICAMRMANTHPGGVIDLMQAVQDRVHDKNFVNVKEVVEDDNLE